MLVSLPLIRSHVIILKQKTCKRRCSKALTYLLIQEASCLSATLGPLCLTPLILCELYLRGVRDNSPSGLSISPYRGFWLDILGGHSATPCDTSSTPQQPICFSVGQVGAGDVLALAITPIEQHGLCAKFGIPAWMAFLWLLLKSLPRKRSLQALRPSRSGLAKGSIFTKTNLSVCPICPMSV